MDHSILEAAHVHVETFSLTYSFLTIIGVVAMAGLLMWGMWKGYEAAEAFSEKFKSDASKH